MNPFLASSSVNRRVIFSNSCSEYTLGLILIPALAPPKGTSTQAHLKVIRADRALTSSRHTSKEKRIPAIEKTVKVHSRIGVSKNNRNTRSCHKILYQKNKCREKLDTAKDIGLLYHMLL